MDTVHVHVHVHVLGRQAIPPNNAASLEPVRSPTAAAFLSACQSGSVANSIVAAPASHMTVTRCPTNHNTPLLDPSFVACTSYFYHS